MNAPMIVAEMGASHLGSIDTAFGIVNAAAAAGADAIKFQTYEPDTICIDGLITGGPWDGRRYRELYAEGFMPWAWQPRLFEYARSIGLIPFSAPFSEDAVQFLDEECDCPIYKIASPEIVHYPLIAKAAKTGKPMIMSTGMASPIEIQRAVDTAKQNGCTDITLLHCISAYPAKPEDMNLKTLDTLRNYNCKIGLSDHSRSLVPAVVAIAYGAEVIEKHIALSRSLGGIDAKFCLEPAEFKNLVDACKQAAVSIGDKILGLRESEKTSANYRRSLWVVRRVACGARITEKDIAVLRPADGLHPVHLRNIIGKKASSTIMPGTPLAWNLIDSTS